MAIKKTALTCAVLCATLLSARGAEASLVSDNSGKTVYDTVTNQTWLADANLAASNTFGVKGINKDGSMSWTTAHAWIGKMNAKKYLGSKHWSLPATALPDNSCSQDPKSAAFGFGCTGSRMGNLFYNQLGGAKGSTIQRKHNADFLLFHHFTPYLYWSSTLWKKVPKSSFSFSFGNGFQGTNVWVNNMYAIAIAPGKVGNFTPHSRPTPRPRHTIAPKCPPGMKCPKPI